MKSSTNVFIIKVEATCNYRSLISRKCLLIQVQPYSIAEKGKEDTERLKIDELYEFSNDSTMIKCFERSTGQQHVSSAQQSQVLFGGDSTWMGDQIRIALLVITFFLFLFFFPFLFQGDIKVAPYSINNIYT